MRNYFYLDVCYLLEGLEMFSLLVWLMDVEL